MSLTSYGSLKASGAGPMNAMTFYPPIGKQERNKDFTLLYLAMRIYSYRYWNFVGKTALT